MRAISLHQPWASAIALGAKTIETRHWPTNYRGPLAIHAAQRCVKSELEMYSRSDRWRAAMNLHPMLELQPELAFGAIVCVARLVDCKRTETIANNFHTRYFEWGGSGSWSEYEMGNFMPGRFGWILADVKPLDKPMPCKGKQGFFSVADEDLRSLCPDWKGWAD